MKATYENNSEYSSINLHLKSEKETDKAWSIYNKLESFGGYELSHFDNEVFMIANVDNSKTISEMKEDYREAKKAA